MARQLRPRRGTTAQNNAYTGALGEVTIDTTLKTVVVHDGATAGGNSLPTKAYVDSKAGGDASAAVSAHVADSDPHPQYLRQVEADALYEVTGAVSAHVALSDPHPQYQRERVSVTESSTATIAVGALTSVLYLTAGSLVASQEINCSDLPDGCELIIYSTNGITALTISGGTIVGSLTSLAAGAFGRVVRAGTTLLVGA